MKIRIVAPVILTLFLVSCGGDVGEADAPAAAEMSPDEQALAELREAWAQHYNLHHASMVADYYAEDAVALGADGSVSEGRDAIEAALETQMEGSPTVTLPPPGETMVFGDRAVSMGSYEIETTPAGSDPMSISGSYLISFSKESGEWEITSLVSNYDSPRPEGWAYASMGDEPPEDEGTMTDLVEGYARHWNLGHPSMVADYYTEDAKVAFSDSPVVTGRAAVASELEESMTESPLEITIHDVATWELGEGWALDGGWYQMDAPDGGDPMQAGTYLILCKQADDGSWQIHWLVSNGHPWAD